jgi:(p)ppGpp synthase/HD superfamily hydrolase
VEFAAAVVLAARVYGARRDRSGGLLVTHGLNVAQALGSTATADAMSAAVLHDMVESTEWTTADLARSGVDPLVCEVIDVLTRRRGETYTDYVRRVCDARGTSGETARMVMVADLTVSADTADSDILRERYEQSLPLVRNALAAAVG